MKAVSIASLAGKTGLFTDGDWVESKDQDPDGDVRLIQLADVAVGKFVDKSSRFLTSESAEKLRCTFLKAGDILIARMPDPIGRACIFPDIGYKCATVVDVSILRVDPQIADSSYVAAMINGEYFLRQVQRHVKGSTRTRISRGNLGTLKIPLPPLSEQKRIAGILDQADALRRLRAQALEKLNTLGQAIFHEMFGDPAENPKGWEIKTLPELGRLDRGVSKHRPRNDPSLLGGDHPLIQTGDVARAGDYIHNYASTYSDLGLAQSRMWAKGTVCITIAANIADTAILEFDACFPDSVVGFDSGHEATNFFVHRWFATVKSRLENIAPTVAQKNINLKILRELPIISPPRNYLERYFEHEKKIRTQHRIYQRTTKASNDLFVSLQHRAFRSEL